MNTMSQTQEKICMNDSACASAGRILESRSSRTVKVVVGRSHPRLVRRRLGEGREIAPGEIMPKEV